MKITRVLAYRVELALHETTYKWSGGKSVSRCGRGVRAAAGRAVNRLLGLSRLPAQQADAGARLPRRQETVNRRRPLRHAGAEAGAELAKSIAELMDNAGV